MSQRIYLRLNIKNTVCNPGVKGLKIRYFKKYIKDPSLCLLDAIYGVWSHYVNYISINYVPNNLFETQYKKHCIQPRC